MLVNIAEESEKKISFSKSQRKTYSRFSQDIILFPEYYFQSKTQSN